MPVLLARPARNAMLCGIYHQAVRALRAGSLLSFCEADVTQQRVTIECGAGKVFSRVQVLTSPAHIFDGLMSIRLHAAGCQLMRGD